MCLGLVVVLAVLSGVAGSPSVTLRPGTDSETALDHPNSVPETEELTTMVRQVRKELQPSGFDVCFPF